MIRIRAPQGIDEELSKDLKDLVSDLEAEESLTPAMPGSAPARVCALAASSAQQWQQVGAQLGPT